MNPGSTKPLAECNVGESGTVRSMDMDAGSRQRLLEMGLLIGSRIDVVRFAPLGDPIEIKVRGYFLSLRRFDAAKIQVEVV